MEIDHTKQYSRKNDDSGSIMRFCSHLQFTKQTNRLCKS